MLKLKNITKSYTTGDFTQQALKKVSLEFRKNEFVAILGPSGSGKTTMLNIIGGLDRYDSGDLIINGKSTKKFKETEWDAYRNNCIGFIFQSYNLISHISILANVEMGMTLSGVSSKERQKKAMEALKKVGLEKHAHKKPNQLSGGQMQRVAIARALANDPEIILADEPTGALDSNTSVQIMELIKEIAKDKLVIMVTHNAELANDYATRIVEFKDGKLINDSKPIEKGEKQKDEYKLKKTSMNFFTALKLSFNNIKTKKGRTLLTAFASSIGIIGIALIMSLSNGFKMEIDNFEKQTVTGMPIVISKSAMDSSILMEETSESEEETLESYTDKKVIYPKKNLMTDTIHQNNITDDYIKYLNKLDPTLISGITYNRNTAVNIITEVDGKYQPVTSSVISGTLPGRLDGQDSYTMDDNYEIIEGKMPTKKNELLLLVDTTNELDEEILKALGFDSTQKEIKFSDITSKEFKVVFNDEYYKKVGSQYILNNDYETLFKSDKALTLKITGIGRLKEDKESLDGMSSKGVFYTTDLVDYIIDKNKDSAIVKAQEKSDVNILTQENFATEEEASSIAAMFSGSMTKNDMLGYLGKDIIPQTIYIYPNDFETKDTLVEYLDDYNKGKDQTEQVLYTDQAKMISTLSKGIMDGVTAVLIAFSAISLVVSSIMIAIITYISVLERTKEIGILRALGARKKDVKRVFNAETFIIGLFSGCLGIIIARLLIIPANIIIESVSTLPNVAKLNPVHAIALIMISIILTVISGAIPAGMASKKDPVIALRTE